MTKIDRIVFTALVVFKLIVGLNWLAKHTIKKDLSIVLIIKVVIVVEICLCLKQQQSFLQSTVSMVD